VAAGEPVALAMDVGRCYALALSPDGKLLATAHPEREGRIRVWEAATGKPVTESARLSFVPERLAFLTSRSVVAATHDKSGLCDLSTGDVERGPRFESRLGCLATCPSQGALFSGHADTNAYRWSAAAPLAALARRAERRPAPDEDGLRRAWEGLGAPVPSEAYPGLWALVAGGDRSVELLGARLRPAHAADEKEVARLVKGLDDEAFEAREKALARLVALGEAAAPALRKHLAAPPSAEAGQKIRDLLAAAEALTPERLRQARAVQVLEYIGSQRAREALRALAAGDPAARLTAEAASALRRPQSRADVLP
jgi:hypothetical protein